MIHSIRHSKQQFYKHHSRMADRLEQASDEHGEHMRVLATKHGLTQFDMLYLLAAAIEAYAVGSQLAFENAMQEGN